MLAPIVNLTNIDALWSGPPKGVEVIDVLAQMGSEMRPEDREHLKIDARRLQAGSSTETYALKNHFELVIVWSGAGSLRYSTPESNGRVAKLSLKPFDTAALPPNTFHEFSADTGQTLVVLTIQGLDGKPFENESGKLGSTPDDVERLKARNIADVAAEPLNWELNAKFRAKRIRLWGKEARVEKHGDVFERLDVDAIKEQLHLTLYTFVGGQTNPGHFHPQSVEFVLALDDGALFTIREKNDPDGWATFGRAQEKPLVRGDMVLVPMAAWHQYINTKTAGTDEQKRCKVLALQTPHPIMHTLVNETDGSFAPE